MEQTHGILIRLTKLTDSSLIIHWFTEGAGLIKTVANGARRPASPFAGKLDLFFTAELVWTPAKRGELHPLKEVVVSNWHMGLRKTYVATLMAGYFCQLLEQSVEPGHPDPVLYDLLRRALDYVDTAGASLRGLQHFERELAKILGVSHERRSAELALREAVGELPAIRRDLLERLSTPGDLDSSNYE